MKDQSNNQPGAQRHAEGEYGDKARQRNLEQLQSGDEGQADGSESDTADSQLGRHRIHEDRQQHDEADLRSEKNRLAHDRNRGK
jgi:hypothetical protein